MSVIEKVAVSGDSVFLKHVPIFSALDDETLEWLTECGIRKSFKKDTIIMQEKEMGNAFFVIATGSVKISRINNEGREIILSILHQSNFFGEMSILDGFSRSANAIALEDSDLLLIKRDDFLDLLRKQPKVSLSLLKEISKRLRDADMKIKILTLKDAVGRIAAVLLQLADDIGRVKNGMVEIDKLPLRHDIANLASTSRETVSRILQNLVNKKLIDVHGSKLKILNYQKLKSLVV
ncbi:MAG: Crp/Fnr family transcriptional regulator [Syntrophothermus sp.]